MAESSGLISSLGLQEMVIHGLNKVGLESATGEEEGGGGGEFRFD